jgi:anti-anti-sigma regulatory factor
MSGNETKLLVSKGGGATVVRIVGAARYSCANDLRSLLKNLKPEESRSVAIDLTESQMMDSTIIGVVSGFARGRKAHAPADGSLVLINPCERVRDGLANVGVSHLFKVLQEACAPPPGSFKEAESAPPLSTLESAKLMLEAHLILMGVDPANMSKFKNVVEVLSDDIARMEAERKPLNAQTPVPPPAGTPNPQPGETGRDSGAA